MRGRGSLAPSASGRDRALLHVRRRACRLDPWLAGAAINRDRNLRLQYLAAVGLNSYRSEAIYNQLVAYRRFPDSLFVADEAWKGRLRAAMR